MGKWKTVKLNEVLKHRKGSIVINDKTEYKLCRVQLHRRGVLLREKQFGHQIKTKKQQLCHESDLIVAEMDAKYGGYGFISPELKGAIVSSHYYLYELDKTQISQDYFQTLISTDYIQNQIEAKGSTNYSSIRAREFLEYEIPLPKLDIQREISKRYLTFSDFKYGLNTEHESQSHYLSQLRQSILQEAIEGKLTADWRKKNPVRKGDPNTDAAALLDKIKGEKQKLIAEGKLKKEKPLAPIKPEEIPFELPKGWVWCRLGSCGYTQTGTTPSTFDKSNFGSDIPFIKPADITITSIDYNNDGLTEKGLNEGRLINKDSVLMVCIGGSIGKSYYIDRNVSCNQQINTITPLAGIKGVLLQYFLQTKYFQIEVWAKAMKSSTPIINKGKWESILLPLPPLTEQKAIVERVDRLLGMVGELGQQVKGRQSQAEQLMQAVLREAFEGR